MNRNASFPGLVGIAHRWVAHLNEKMADSRLCRRRVVQAFACVVGLVTWIGSTTAPASGQSVLGDVRRADELYRAEKLQQAASAYEQILRVAGADDRRHCFERLLAIYGRVGRHDQAIQTALKFREWLDRPPREAARIRELDLDLGRWYFSLGHYAEAEPRLQSALVDIASAPLAPPRAVTALTFLALAAEKQGDRVRADRAWQEVERFTLAYLDNPRQQLDLSLRIECVRRLADSYRFQGKPQKAIQRLEELLPELERLKGPGLAVRRDTLRQLAGHLAADNRLPEAEKRLREALELHHRVAPSERLTQADLSSELADVLDRQSQIPREEAKNLREQAAAEYNALLKTSHTDSVELAGALDAFWKLQVLYQRTSQYDQAMKLIGDQSTLWAGSLIAPRLHTEQGTLRVLVGEFTPARRLLDAAVRELESQSPVNLTVLPPALLNLAVAELGADNRARAEELGRRCLGLYNKHHLANDLVRIETYNLLGACAAQDGDYAHAIAHFREGVKCCRELQPAADAQHCNLLLNIALLYKAQGDLSQALLACKEARRVYNAFAAKDERGLAAIDAAMATLFAGQRRLEEANKLAASVQERCAKNDIKGGPLVSTALHCQALFHLSKGDVIRARQNWEELAALHGPNSPMQPRTLNYLAMTYERERRLDKAAEVYQSALDLQNKDPLAFPVTHFTTLWRLADVTDRLASSSSDKTRREEARRLLEEAVTLVENARLRTYGGPRQRATFFAQFEPAFERLVTWYLREGDVAAALVTAARGRSLTLLDQMLLGNADPRHSVIGSEGEKWRQDEVRLRREIATLRSEAQLAASKELDTLPGRQLRDELDKAQREYVRVYNEILNASPLYPRLGGKGFDTKSLDQLRKALGPKQLLLAYHVGREQCYLLVVGDTQQSAKAFALLVPTEVAERVASPSEVSLEQALEGGRGIALRRAGAPQPDLPPRSSTPGQTRALGQEVLRALVANYLDQVVDPNFRTTRGLHLESKQPARPLGAQRPELLADILIPAAAREHIRALAPECVIIVPDGALHKLPFEALLSSAGERPSYLIDELPPLTYAPSVAILARLLDQKPSAPEGLRSLLTVADPAYPVEKEAPKRADRPVLSPDLAPASLWGRFPLLQHAKKESERVSECFERTQVKSLRGESATKTALIAALPGPHVVHIAAHGITDNSFDNQFGALVLTPPPAQEAQEHDGFLSLHEIYRLRLDKCELAVLSACVTNVGPQLPLEAGVTLATGFLAAGARRVVASHWSVDDESTSELMAAFFREVKAAKPGDRVGYARALKQARLQVRGRVRWSAPYYWAPFVLIGPAD
jgi:CHAT domain-containing protein/tetratricopeptide (TPR) repeat protein